jgi:hypothetical protein
MLRYGALLALLVAALASPAGAVVIFSDDFERAGSRTVGAPADFPTEIWEEQERNSADVRVSGGALVLRENRSNASQVLSTLGYENIVLSYEWRPLNARSTRRDTFTASVPGGGRTHRLDTAGGMVALNLSSLADNLAEFDLRFRIRIFDEPGGPREEGVRIFSVTLTGDRISSSAAVPEPATWALTLAGFGLAGGSLRRRRRLRPCLPS